ncbi:MAG: GNAT family N-acetyltransferase [Chloroflexi bacterium]|nr:GNAT family N-acetyltransferase [Chloroflexota bacterium]
MMEVREANPRELEAWDDLTVHPGGGHVLQSMAWACHRAATGWRPHHLILADGSAVLALERPWPLLGGSSVYLPRGPIPAGSAPAMAARLDAVTAWLRARGADVVASDAEVPAATGYPALLRDIGYGSIEEIQPSRHRYSLGLGHGADAEAVFGAIGRSTRQRIRAAERAGTRIVRHDRSTVGGEDGRGADPGPGFEMPAEPLAEALDRFYDLLLHTGERRHFSFGPRASFLRWWQAAHDAGHLALLEARAADGTALAGLVLYRHGGRLSTVHSADDATTRRAHPGALHLLRWRAIELAIHEGCAEMDLGGVDVPGARHEPRPGDATYGLAEHKRAFGATWLELSGAHERVLRPGHYRIGRALARTRRMIGR